MNPQVPKSIDTQADGVQECSPSKGGILSKSVTTLAALAVSCVMAGKPAYSQEATIVNTSSESGITCPTNLASEPVKRKELSEADLLTCFGNDFIGGDINNIDLNSLPDEVKALAGYWNSFSSSQKNRVLRLYVAGESPIDAVAQVHNASTNEGVPEDVESIKISIIKEATANGIDPDFDLPGLTDELNTYFSNGQLSENGLQLIVDYARESGKQIPVVLAYLKVNGYLDEVNEDLDEAQKLLKKATETADLATDS